jgi:hypothetical protein
MIAHVLPGRIRLRHASPLSQDQLDALSQRIRGIAPSVALTHTPQSGSTLVAFTEYDRTKEVLTLIQPLSLQKTRRSSAVCHTRLRWPSMTVVKRGMSGSLIASLGLVALRREGGHALTGGLFLVFLSPHLWVYRKRLAK